MLDNLDIINVINEPYSYDEIVSQMEQNNGWVRAKIEVNGDLISILDQYDNLTYDEKIEIEKDMVKQVCGDAIKDWNAFDWDFAYVAGAVNTDDGLIFGGGLILVEVYPVFE